MKFCLFGVMLGLRFLLCRYVVVFNFMRYSSCNLGLVSVGVMLLNLFFFLYFVRFVL